MQTFIDLVGSTIIAASVILSILGLNFLLSDSSRDVSADLYVQENMVEFTRLVQYDISKIGQGDTLSAPVLIAESQKIKFIGDVDNSMTSDTVTYYCGDSTKLKGTPNPKDFPIYRVVRYNKAGVTKPDTMKMSVGLTKFTLTFYDDSGKTTTDVKKIKGIDVDTNLENPFPVKDSKGNVSPYAVSGNSWKSLIYPRNLNVPKK